MGTQCDVRAGGRRTAPQRIGDPARRDASVQMDQEKGTLTV